MTDKAIEQSCTKKVQLSLEDNTRVIRLREEIIGRVEEIARILARNLETSPQFPVKKFTVDIRAIA